jgi:hypothetical protein
MVCGEEAGKSQDNSPGFLLRQPRPVSVRQLQRVVVRSACNKEH